MNLKDDLIAYGIREAHRDKALIQERTNNATEKQLSSRWWLLKHYVYCAYLGFKGSPLYGPAATAYRKEMIK